MSIVKFTAQYGAFMVNVGGVSGGVKEVINDHSSNAARFGDIGAAAITLDGPSSGSTTAIRSLSGIAVTAPLIINLKNGVRAGDATGSDGLLRKAGYINLNDVSNKATDAVIHSTGAANVIRQINLASNSVTSLTINAQTSLTIGDTALNPNGTPIVEISGFSSQGGTITINGAGKVNLNDLHWAVKAINASGNTGGIAFVQSTSGLLRQVVGSSAADSFTLKGNVIAAGGAGNDVFNILAPASGSAFSTITDASAGDMIRMAHMANASAPAKIILGAGATFQHYLNAATASNVVDYQASWFQFNGNTYVVQNNNAATTFAGNSDIVVKLSGEVDLSSATWGNGAITLTSGTSAAGPVAVIAPPPPVAEPAGDAVVSFKHAGGRRIVGVERVKDLKEVVNYRTDSEATFKDIGSAALTLDGVTAGNTTFIRASNGSVVTDALTINLENGTKVGPAYSLSPTASQALTGFIIGDDASNGATHVTINSSGAANVVLGMRLAKSTVTAVTINADTDLTIGDLIPSSFNGAVVADMSGFDANLRATITVNGAGKVNLNDLNWLVKAVDASANTGGVTFVQNSNTYFRQAIGGSGNDHFTLKGNAVATGGAGSDVFAITAPPSGTTFSTITDFSAGDTIKISQMANMAAPAKISLAPGATFQNYLNAAAAGDTVDHLASWFVFGGNTYVVQNENTATTFQNNSDIVVKLAGQVDLGMAAWDNGAIALA